MPRTLLVIDKNVAAIKDDADFILNLSVSKVYDKRIIDSEKSFREILENTKKDYIEFIYRFGQGTGFLNRKLENTSLWWFSEIQHKDSFWDSFFRDITIINLIKKIHKELGLDEIRVLSDSTLLKVTFGEKIKSGTLLLIFRLVFRRSRLFLKTLLIIIFLKRDNFDLPAENIFFSFFPTHWFKFQDTYLDRFLKAEPYNTPGYAFAVYLDKVDRNIIRKLPKRSIVVQSYVGVKFLLRKFFNFSHYFWYLKNIRKIRELSYFCGIDIWPVYKKYLLETVLYNDLFYSIMIHGLRNIVLNFNPKKIISPGEFGPETKALAASCLGTKTNSIWYQHTPFCRDKLWFFNHPEEIKVMPIPDKMLVWSEYYKDFLDQYALYSKNHCEIVENIRYSDFVKAANSQLPKKYFFAPTLSENEVRQFCYFISELCKDGLLKESQAVLKLHPAAKGLFDINKILPGYKNIKNIEILLDVPGLENYIDNILCVIAGGTTLGIEAAFFGIPVIQYIPRYGLNWSPLDESSATCFSDIDSLRKSLGDLSKIKPVDYRLFYMPPTLKSRLFQDAISK